VKLGGSRAAPSGNVCPAMELVVAHAMQIRA
jgi:hypothetical protein